MLVLGEATWTLKAIHLACTIARREGRELVLVKMVEMQHTGWLGMPEEGVDLTLEERRVWKNCVNTAHDYGVTPATEYFQYVDLTEAIPQAAEQYEASVVFATLPSYRFGFWRKFQLGLLERHMRQQGCALYTLAPTDPQADWTPSVVVSHQ